MKNNKTILILTISLLASIILGACDVQTSVEPADASAPQNTDPEPAPTTEADAETSEKPAAAEAPEESSADAPAAEVSFTNDVLPIIESRCVNCHGGDRIEKGLVFLTYEDVMAGSDNGPVVVPGDAANSLLVELIATQMMPKRGPKLTPPQVQLITDWVAAGAPNN